MKKTHAHAYLSIDFGNSNTRINIGYLDENGKMQSRLKTLSNRYGYLDDSELYLTESKDYTEKNSKVFRFGNEIVCIDKICASECGSNCVKPTSTDKKFDSKFSKYAVRLALMQGYMELSAMLDTPIEDLDIIWHIAGCLPAYDMNAGGKKMKELITEVDSIDFIIPDVQKKIVQEQPVMIRPEGFTAYVGTVFENKSMFRYKMKSVAQTNILVVDMGDGTTDLALIRETTLSQKSLHSVPMGGSTITQNLKKEMEQRYGHAFSLDTMQKATITGELQIGNRTMDISKDVERIRKTSAVSVANSIKGYFDTLGESIDEINYILLCGGGAIPQEQGYEMKSYQEFMREELQNMMRYADFLEMPYIKQVGKDGKETQIQMNPRLLNVIGLGILNSPNPKK